MTLSAETKDLYDQGRIITRQMLRFQFGSGTFGFISSVDPLTYAGVVYQPFGLIEVSMLSSGSGTASNDGFVLTLAESPDDGLTPEILIQIEDEDYRDRPVVVMDAHFHPDTGALVQVEIVARGYLDVIEHENDPDRGYVITATCESRSLDYSRRNGRVRSSSDQQRRAPGDKFFEHAAKAGRVEIFWGRARASVAAASNAASSIVNSLRDR